MRRTRHEIFRSIDRARYIVLWDVLWRMIDCSVVPARADLLAAFREAVERHRLQGWKPEGREAFGFVFLSRDRERRLLTLTDRDPADHGRQTFSPYR